MTAPTPDAARLAAGVRALSLAELDEIEASMAQDIERLERFWPPSKRGSNAQAALDSIKSRRGAAEDILREGLAKEKGDG